mgnify:CR=1 FL=1
MQYKETLAECSFEMYSQSGEKQVGRQRFCKKNLDLSKNATK